MMRRLLCGGFLLLWAAAGMAASKPIAQVQLECKAWDQVLSPDGSQLVVRCRDSHMYVLSLPDGKTLRTISAEQRPYAVAYSPDGRWLAVGFHDGTVEVSAAKGTAAGKQWKAAPRRVDALSFLHNDKTLLVGAVDEAVRVWELGDSPKLLATLPFEFGGISACALSPHGKTLVIAGNDTVLRWYDTATWKKTHENREFLLETFALTFTSDGKQVLAGGADARITVLDAATAKQVRQLPKDEGSYIVGLELLAGESKAATLYLDDAGEKPPHAVVWDLASAKSSVMGNGAVPTCGGKVSGKLWVCTAEGNKLTVAEWE